MFMFAICRRPSVCRLSVTFVHPTQPIEIFGNVSMPFGTLAICDPSVKILPRSSQGNPSVGGLNQRVLGKCSDLKTRATNAHEDKTSLQKLQCKNTPLIKINA